MALDLAQLAAVENDRTTRDLAGPLSAVDPSTIAIRLCLRGSPQAWQRPNVVRAQVSEGEARRLHDCLMRDSSPWNAINTWREEHNRLVRTITPAETIAAEELIAAALRVEMDSLKLTCDNGGIAWGARYRFHLDNYIRKDLDNLIACVMEAGSGVIYKDDCQIVESAESKILHSGDPRTEWLFYRVGFFR